jgi:hypothetical protein
MDSSSDNRRSAASSERVDGITGVGWISPTVQQADFPLAARTATQTRLHRGGLLLLLSEVPICFGMLSLSSAK